MENRKQNAVVVFAEEIRKQLATGYAGEHGYRPALIDLIQSFDGVSATNDPRRTEHGNPDIVIYKTSNTDVILGRGEAKDITVVDLDKTAKTEQLQRYAGYEKLFLTNGLEFIFYQNGEEYERVRIGTLQSGTITFDSSQFDRFINELYAFLTLKPESIKNGKRLSIIMGGKARRIKDNINYYLGLEDDKNTELLKIYNMMRELLVHDLTIEKFADMYSQTLVYGLFIARYGDTTPENFTRSEARDLIPKSNPFLRHFFDHIVGPEFDNRLAHIVDELCQIFSVSNVQQIVHKHLRIVDETADAKDPIIHFYEDFLKEYDPDERKKMGAYYTPVPVVKFIVKQVDRILKEEFGIVKGLASSETFTKTVDLGQEVDIIKTQSTGRQIKTKTRLVEKDFYRVQVLDPAVGTATFLNETIKYIHEEFKGQEGRWPAYVKDNLVKRLFGFELMMAPYTIAHLKLGMTLRETGVSALEDRLNIFLTNTLEEGIPAQQDLFSFGLAQAVSEESQHAAEVKSENPIMIVMGNPPYSVSSNNKSKWIEGLVADYKKNLNERNIQPLSDDYIKFIRFAEEMISKTGEGIVAMITNNSYIDGIIHRQMRKHLLQTFDKIYVLDLHGNSKKKETTPEGGIDENVFDIQQGVSIILAVKKDRGPVSQLAEVYQADMFGRRKDKFGYLITNDVQFKLINTTEPKYLFVARDTKTQQEYDQFVSIRALMPFGDAGIKTHRDAFVIDFDKNILMKKIEDFYELSPNEVVATYGLKETGTFSVSKRQQTSKMNTDSFQQIEYRPFDYRWSYYTPDLMDRPREKTMRQFISHKNTGLVLNRQSTGPYWSLIQVTDKPIDNRSHFSINGIPILAPLYIYHEDGTRTPNFAPAELTKLCTSLFTEPSPEDVLDYVYAVLHSPSYREKYNGSLKTDFPRVPVPTQADFDRLVPYGRELRELHLMESVNLNRYTTTFPIGGSDYVEKVTDEFPLTVGQRNTDGSKVEYQVGRIYINDTQYFGNVPKVAWDFYIGGYQPAQKWLKDRKGRKLSNSDLDHYQKIIKILIETDRIMKEIDLNIMNN